MKRLFALIIVLSLLVLGGTLVSANSQTRWRKSDPNQQVIRITNQVD